MLLVVPAGLKYQWAEAIAKFTDLPTQAKRFKGERLTIPDSRHCMVVDGTPERRRKKQYQLARETADLQLHHRRLRQRDQRRAGRQAASARSSPCSTRPAQSRPSVRQRTIAIKEKITPPWRMALTATPIDNRPDELFSIMEWVDASVLGRGDLFDLAYIDRNHFGDPVGYKNLNTLRKRLGDAMYRKSVHDPDIAPFMPDRKIVEWAVPMDGSTREVYTKMAHDLLAALAEAQAIGKSFNAAAHYAGHKTPTRARRSAGSWPSTRRWRCCSTTLTCWSRAPWTTPRATARDRSTLRSIYGSGLLDDLEHSPKLSYLTYRLGCLMEDGVQQGDHLHPVPDCAVADHARCARSTAGMPSSTTAS